MTCDKADCVYFTVEVSYFSYTQEEPYFTEAFRPLDSTLSQRRRMSDVHRSFKLPPDGYPPTLDANLVPPPHELSMPVPPTPKPSASVPTSNSKEERKKRSVSQPPEHTRIERAEKTLRIPSMETAHHSIHHHVIVSAAEATN